MTAEEPWSGWLMKKTDAAVVSLEMTYCHFLGHQWSLLSRQNWDRQELTYSITRGHFRKDKRHSEINIHKLDIMAFSIFAHCVSNHVT